MHRRRVGRDAEECVRCSEAHHKIAYSHWPTIKLQHFGRCDHGRDGLRVSILQSRSG